MAFALFMDEDSSRRALVSALRNEGWDVLTVREAGRSRMSDHDQLEFASGVDRTILTCNQGDFARLHQSWLAVGRAHAGIIVLTSQQIPVGVVLRRLNSIRDRTPDDMTNTVLYVSR